jgi:serine protease
MKRTLFFTFCLLLSAELFGGDSVHSYLIGTRHSSAESVARIARSDDSGVGPGRNVQLFDIVDAYRADLTDADANALAKSPEVRYVEEEVPRYALGLRARLGSNEQRNVNGQTIPWGVKTVNALPVWSVTRGADINVAVLDSGIDLKHPDLLAAYAGGFNTYASEGSAPADDAGHGTHVAGTIAATDNNIGVVGVAPGVHLWAVRVLHSDGSGGSSGDPSNIVGGIQWVVQQKKSRGGDWIISMSLGSCSPSVTEGSAISTAINAGILVVAAAGNHFPDQPDVCTTSTRNGYQVDYPAAYPGVVAVAAVDSKLKVADFSNFGPQVAISGPGVDVLSTVPVGKGSISSVTTPSGTALASEPLTGSPRGSVTDVFVDCGLGKTAADFPPSVNGHIALIKRGDVSFAIKVKNAQDAGATAVIIYNKDDSDIGFTLTGDPADEGHVWPLTVAISFQDGQALLANPGTVTASYSNDDYDSYNGTSMATPHVAAAAALAWSVAPNVTAATVKQALLATARDIGDAGVDNLTGYGFVDALAAAKLLNPSAFSSNGAGQPPTPVTGRVPGRRGH